MEKVRSITASLRKLIGLDGRESYDPEGGPLLDFDWDVVERPPNVNIAVFNPGGDKTVGDVQINQVGEYAIRLVVRDERGLESLEKHWDEATVYVYPRELEILLHWDVGTDVDLHVVEPGGFVGDYGSGTAGTSTGSDCSAFNRRPNWNDLATARDDPSLDKDDVTGRGPEIVSLDSPIDGAEYTVFAHYCDSRATNVPVGVQAEIYVRGMLVGAVPEAGSYQLRSGELWEVGKLTWEADGPSAAIADQSMMSPIDAPQLCLSD
jgi:hypothetical protein